MLAKHLTEIRGLAVSIFKLELIADHWLNSFNHSLGCAPLIAAETISGANKVKKILNDIKDSA